MSEKRAIQELSLFCLSVKQIHCRTSWHAKTAESLINNQHISALSSSHLCRILLSAVLLCNPFGETAYSLLIVLSKQVWISEGKYSCLDLLNAFQWCFQQHKTRDLFSQQPQAHMCLIKDNSKYFLQDDQPLAF